MPGAITCPITTGLNVYYLINFKNNDKLLHSKNDSERRSICAGTILTIMLLVSCYKLSGLQEKCFNCFKPYMPRIQNFTKHKPKQNSYNLEIFNVFIQQ